MNIESLSREELVALNQKMFNELCRVNERLKESEDYKAHFLSHITNEIVNPFASIFALAQNIRQVEISGNQELKKMAALIYEETFYLNFQLKNIFASAMIESGEDKLFAIDVAIREVVNKSISFFEHESERKSLSVQTQFRLEREHLVADPGKLELIIRNLLSNAIKFSPEKGHIGLKIELQSERLRIAIKDEGNGIPKADHEKVFNRFKQLEEESWLPHQGQGLGLSLIYSLVQIWEGKMGMSNPRDDGFELWIDLPELNKEDRLDDDLDDFLLSPEAQF